MAKIIRCRCPVCGMLVRQNRLNEDHDFEFVVEEIGSKGRGRIYHVYRKPDKVEGTALLHFKLALAGKLHDIADRLLEAVRADVAEKKKAKVVKKDIPHYETDEYDEFVPSSQVSPLVDYDESVITEFEAETKLGDEREWQDSGELSPQTTLED